MNNPYLTKMAEEERATGMPTWPLAVAAGGAGAAGLYYALGPKKPKTLAEKAMEAAKVIKDEIKDEDVKRVMTAGKDAINPKVPEAMKGFVDKVATNPDVGRAGDLLKKVLKKVASEHHHVKHIYPGSHSKLVGGILGGMAGATLMSPLHNPVAEVAGTTLGAMGGIGLQMYRDTRQDQAIDKGWIKPYPIHRPTLMSGAVGGAATGAVLAGVLPAVVFHDPSIMATGGIPGAVAGAALGTAGSALQARHFDHMPSVYKDE